MRIQAHTLSVIMNDSTTVHCGVDVGNEYTNITLRFDRGPKAMICGYPQSWDIHDVNTDPYDSDSPTGADLYEADMVDDGRVYISADTEIKILKKLKRSIEKQFNDCSWMDCELTLNFQLSILNKINRAIIALRGAK
jgi:hypothetical protein